MELVRQLPRDDSILIDVDGGIKETDEAFAKLVHNILLNLCGIWTSTSPQDVKLHRLMTANSNYVFTIRCTAPRKLDERDPPILLLRIYGKMNVMFDRTIEERNAIILADSGIIPPFYGVFGNGRVEHYVEHSPLCALDFRADSTVHQLVAKLRRIHEMTQLMPESVSDDAFFWERLNILRNFAIESSRFLRMDSSVDPSRREMLQEIIDWNVFDDYAAVKYRALETKSPIVFAHCDLHHGNVIIVEGDYLIIDYEYSVPAPRGFDLANYFCEMCSDYDSDEGHEMNFFNYPDIAKRDEIFRSYLGSDASAEEVKKLEMEVSAYLPFVHLQWAHWGIVKARESHASTFDNFRFAYLRYQQWHELTKDVLGH